MIALARHLYRRLNPGLVLISPPLLYAVILLAVPVAAVVALSFWSQDYLEIQRDLTFVNYQTAWTGHVYQALMLRSIKIALLVSIATVLLAFPMAYFLSFHVADRRKPLWLFLITIPFWTSYLVRIFLWKVILGYNGVINGSLTALGLVDEPLRFILYNQAAVVMTLSHAWVPFAVLPIYVALEKIDRSLLEVAEDLGDGHLRRFCRITLPLAMPGVIAATLIVFIPTVGDYITPNLVGGPNGLMIANMIEVQFKKANNEPLGAALALTAMALVGAIALLLVWATRKYLRVPT